MIQDINDVYDEANNISFQASDIDNLKKLINKKWIEIASGDIVVPSTETSR